jgi:uncharacterized membrane-anchored protein YjiN (DUF445 family)
MKEIDQKPFLILMAMLNEAFKEQMSSERGKIYFEFLKKYSISEVTYAVKQSIKKLKFFPKVADLIEFINPDERYEFIGDPKQIELRNEKQDKEALEYIKQMARLITEKKSIPVGRLPYKDD